MQPDARAPDDFDQSVVGPGQLAAHSLDETVDGRGGIVAEIPAGLPAAFDDGGRVDAQRGATDVNVESCAVERSSCPAEC